MFQQKSVKFKGHIKKFEIFREHFSKKLLIVCKEMSELQEMCEGFERDQSAETKTEYRLPDRELLYNSYLKIQSDNLIGVVENANKGAKQELENLEKRKTELVKSIFETFNLEFRP